MIKVLSLIAFLFTCTSSYSASVVTVDYGYSKIDYEPMNNHNVTPLGSGLGLSIGSRSGLLGTELYYRSLAAKADYIHDAQSGEFEHQQKTYGAALKVYLTKQLFLRFGYGFSRIEQSNLNPRESYRNEQINQIYALVEKSTSSGPSYGVGYNFFDGKRWDIYAAINREHIYDNATELRMSVGIKFYFKLGIRSAFTK